MDIHTLVIVLILGVIEGLTEFLPVSSTGHMLLVANILGGMSDLTKIFTVIVQLGSILAVVITFWDRLYGMCVFYVKNIFIKQYYKSNHLCIGHVLLGLLPGTVLGIIFHEKVRLILEPIYVVYGLVVGSIFLLLGEVFFFRVFYRTSHVDDITYLQAFLIGCFQCLAFWPGFSRSGATIGGGLLVGLNRRTSLEFSFFLAVPTILGAVILTIYHYGSGINVIDGFLLIFGSLVALVIASFTIKFFLKIIRNVSLFPFIIYRFLLAGGIYLGLIV